MVLRWTGEGEFLSAAKYIFFMEIYFCVVQHMRVIVTSGGRLCLRQAATTERSY